MARAKFPVLGVIILLVGIFWLFDDIGLLQTNVPWIPIIVIVIGAGLIMNRVTGR